MEKKTKKVGAATAATAAVAGAAVAAGATILGSDSSEALAVGEPLDADEDIMEGEVLPELEVVGHEPTLDGGTLANVEVMGHVHEDTTESETAETHEAASEVHHAEKPEAPVAQAEPINTEEESHIAQAEAPLSEHEPQIAAPEEISQNDEGEYEDEDLEEGLALNNVQPSSKEPGIMDEIADAVHKIGEEIGIFHPDEQDNQDDFNNTADGSDFIKH